MANSSEAYDFSLFETHYVSTARAVRTAKTAKTEKISVESARRNEATVRDGNTVRVAPQPKKKEKPKKQQERRNIIELPEKELKKNSKPKRHPLKMLAISFSMALIFTVLLSIVYSQVQLTELTEQINAVTADLNEAQSVQVQLEMQASSKMDSEEIADYAERILGMRRITEGQTVYLNAVTEDKGTVVKDSENESIFSQMWSEIKSWFA